MNSEPTSVQRLREILRKSRDCLGVDLGMHTLKIDSDVRKFISSRNWRLKGKYLYFNNSFFSKKK